MILNFPFSEGDTKFFLCYYFSATRRSRVSKVQSVKVLGFSVQALFSCLVLRDASRVSGADCKQDETSSSSLKQTMHSTNTLEHALVISKMYDKHVCDIPGLKDYMLDYARK